MRIRVIVEDDEGKVIGEGEVPISVLPDANREMLEQLRRLVEEQREAHPYVPVYPQPYIPQYPQPWQPIGPYYGDAPPFYRIWCSSHTTVSNTDPSPTDTTGGRVE